MRNLFPVLLILFSLGQVPCAYAGLTVMANVARTGPDYYFVLYLTAADFQGLDSPHSVDPLPKLNWSR